MKLDENCFYSGINTFGFEFPYVDAVAINFLSAQGIPLMDRGYVPSELGVYIDKKRFIIAPFLLGSIYFGPGGKSIGLEDEKPFITEDYDNLLKQYASELDRLTIITRDRDITNLLLEAEGLTNIVGKPNDSVPHIEAKHYNTPVDILTGYYEEGLLKHYTKTGFF